MNWLETPILQGGPTTSMDCSCFRRVQVVNNPLGGTLIAWDLNPDIRTTGPVHFYIDFGRSGTEDWEALNQIPVVDECTFADATRRQYNADIDYYYRVRAVFVGTLDVDGNCQVCTSQPQSASGMLSRQGWYKARKILKYEQIYGRQVKPKLGWLLKRKTWGTPCNVCRDWDTGGTQQVSCESCWGTGILGGYWKGLDFQYTLVDAPWGRQYVQDDQRGPVKDIGRVARASAYPFVDTYDILVARDSGTRWLVRRIDTAAEIEEVPLIVNLQLRQVPATDVVYRVPIEGTPVVVPPAQDSCGNELPPPEPDDPAFETCGWKRGLDAAFQYMRGGGVW